MNKFLLAFFAFLLFTTQSWSQEKFITVGSGGGFSGMVNVYKIESSGKVWKGKGIGEIKYTECAKIKKKRANSFIASVSVELKKITGNVNRPGNMYYFIAQSGNDVKVTWSSIDDPVPEATKKLYQQIMESITSLKYRPVK